MTCAAAFSAPPVWPEMLAARGRDQPVERIVGVVGRRLDALVGEEHDVLDVGVVADAGDVADRIVEIAQVLHGPRVRGETRRAQCWSGA